jgi:serine/threonine protein kinase
VDGTPFGRYRLVELLGRGGMGEVWRAHDTDTDRVVALKVLPGHLSENEDFQRRFRREAHAAARLNNPHVIPIHHYGEIDGRLYVDMRLIEGRDLGSVLADGPLEPARAVRIIEQVALALHAAHKVGLLHRDIKPSNILLDESDFAYLIDFGISRALDETRITKSGFMLGTFQYIAPERLGTGVDEDARADVYSLACVLYEALTGSPPFEGDTMARLVAAHLSTPPPRPSINQPNVPPRVDQVIATGMAKNPDQRYATTIELADAARNAITAPIARAAPSPPTFPVTEQAGNRVTAQPALPQRTPPTPTRAGGISRGTKIALGVGAAALVLGLVAVVVSAQDQRGPAGSSPTSPSTSSASSYARPGVVVTPAVPARAPKDLTGSTVSLSASMPTRNQVFTNVLTGTVPVHWAKGALYSQGNSTHQVPAAFDVTGTQVTETFLIDTPLASGQFNGPVYTFTGAPPIANVTFNAAQSAPGVAPAGISYDADTIAVNDRGIYITNGAKQVLDVPFAQ